MHMHSMLHFTPIIIFISFLKYYQPTANKSYFPTNAWKLSVFGVIMDLNFPHSDWIWRDTEMPARITPNTDTFYAKHFN